MHARYYLTSMVYLNAPSLLSRSVCLCVCVFERRQHQPVRCEDIPLLGDNERIQGSYYIQYLYNRAVTITYSFTFFPLSPVHPSALVYQRIWKVNVKYIISDSLILPLSFLSLLYASTCPPLFL